MKRGYDSLIESVYFSVKSDSNEPMKASRETRTAYIIGLKNWTISFNNLSLL